MNTKIHPLLVASLVIAAGAALWAVAGQKPGGMDETAAVAADKNQYAQLLAAQQAQNARLDHLEAMLGGIAEAAGVSLATPSAASNRQHPEATPQEAETVREKAMGEAEAGFNAEPVSAAWSTRNEKMIGDAFSPQSLASKNSPAPRTHEVSCRSKTCRIEMVYANDREADEGTLFLLSDIGGVFGQSRPFQRVLPDGSVELVMYATSSSPPLRPHKH